jgi:spore maturation protein CgeB
MVIGPIRDLGLTARIYGVRYPAGTKAALRDAGIEYGGWLANYLLPEVFAHYRVTVHLPRRPYVDALPGVPTIRPFEAMACGIPLVSAPWNDCERLFAAGKDYLVARDGTEMKRHLRALLGDAAMAEELARHARRTILARHTCAHRTDELLGISAKLGLDVDLPRDKGDKSREGKERDVRAPS